VVEVDTDGLVSRLIEKPLTLENNRVAVGVISFAKAASSSRPLKSK